MNFFERADASFDITLHLFALYQDALPIIPADAPCRSLNTRLIIYSPHTLYLRKLSIPSPKRRFIPASIRCFLTTKTRFYKQTSCTRNTLRLLPRNVPPRTSTQRLILARPSPIAQGIPPTSIKSTSRPRATRSEKTCRSPEHAHKRSI